MVLTAAQKQDLKRQVAESLSSEKEIRRVVVFGSFLGSDDPHDMDIAIFQDSSESYLPLALRYRRKLRPVADKIPIDVIPIRPDPRACPLLEEVEKGEVVYER